MSAKTVRNIREPLKKPRPLKPSASTDQMKLVIQDPKDTVIQKSRADILADLETLNISISNCNFDEVTAADISRMCAILKKRGEELDSFHKDALDRYFCTLRNASREDRLDVTSRLKLLEVIEMRAMHWKINENLSNYFNMKFLDLEHGIDRLNIAGTISPPVAVSVHSSQNQNVTVGSGIPLAPGEVLRSSGKFPKPTKIAGKNYFKDEIVIRNSDSGKVMGIKGRRVHMIEELSDTVISFQRVNPGARDRLVQITGPHEEAIGHAKLLVEDTIRRNASPVRDVSSASEIDIDNKEHAEYGTSYSVVDNQPFMKKHLMHSHSMGDASFREISLSVVIGEDVITLTGTKPELLKTAKLVLTEYFAGETELSEKRHNSICPDLQATSYNAVQRFDLKKQASFKDNIPNSLWNDSNTKRESISSFSSSDEDMIKDEKRSAVEKLHNFSSHVFATDVTKNQASSPLPHSSSRDKVLRSFSVPSEFTIAEGFQLEPSNKAHNLLSASEEEVLPPIPPPSYKKRTYCREFLLNCAKSPLSHNQPVDYAHIHQHFQEIICHSPIMFDPNKYLEKEMKMEDS